MLIKTNIKTITLKLALNLKKKTRQRIKIKQIHKKPTKSINISKKIQITIKHTTVKNNINIEKKNK